MSATATATVPTSAEVTVSAAGKFQKLRSELKGAFIERDGEIDALLTAFLAGEHVLLLGPWGTGKSAVTNAMARALDASYFAVLLTKHTAPEEVHGPWNLPLLKEGKYERITTGKFPEARFAFLDEIFKSSSALLNGFLTALNEREFDNGGTRVSIPLEFAVGASNELPQDESLGALFDRFLVRRWVNYISDRDARRKLLMMSGDPADLIQVRLSGAEIDALRLAVRAVDYSGVVEEVLDLTEEMAASDIEVSDRRWRKVMKLVQASAVMNGRDKATTEDLMPLADALWDDPEDYAKVYGMVAKAVSPDLQKALQLLDAATEVFTSNGLDKADLSDSQMVAKAAQANKELERIRNEVSSLRQTGPVIEATAKIATLHGTLAKRLKDAVFGRW